MRNPLKLAERHLIRALKLLDGNSAPADIGAYVDMAIQRLKVLQQQGGVSGESDRLGDHTSSSSGEFGPN